ncbi:hypothetical protein BGZ52_011595, partial [Haplosporangium bisporale]
PLLEYVQSSAVSICASKQIAPEDLKEWIERATTIVKELVELDIAKVFDKAYFDDGRGPKSSKSSEAASDNNSKSSEDECCGGSKKGSQDDSCCKSKTTTTPSAVPEEVESEASGSGCCGGKNAGSCSSSETKRDASNAHSDTSILPSGLPALSSRPDQILADYRSRVRTLLRVFQMDSLIDLA